MSSGKENVDWDEIHRILTSPPIEDKNFGYGECQHKQVVLDDEAHTVTCEKCGKELDPFWYLQLLAKEWKMRQYNLSIYRGLHERVIKYEDEQRAKSLAQQAYRLRPSKPGRVRDVWDEATKILGCEPPAIFSRGKYWYVGDDRGGTYALDYLAASGQEVAHSMVFDRLEEPK